MRAIGAAITALADDPYPVAGFHWGRYHRLGAGRYQIMYVVYGDMITIEHVSRVTED
jgi:hypothetical protein